MSHNKINSPTRILAAMLLLGLTGGLAADDAQPRYVSGDGLDRGDCRNLFRPCRTPAYALTQAGKGDWIKVTTGDYPIASAGELHSLIGALGRLQGGMDPLLDFKVQNPDNNISTLIGVPPEYRDLFQQAGFRIIVDTKGVSVEEQANMQSLSKQLFSVRKSHGRTDCVNSRAGQFPCQNINLLAHLSFSDLDDISVAASDIWGFVDLNTHREYAIIGLSHGAAFVDVTDPANPFVVGNHEGLPSTWRDIKIHQVFDESANRWRAYAYISTEASMDLAIFDLSGLPNSIERVPHTSDHKSAHNVYVANVDYTFGIAQPGDDALLTVAGANLGGGRYRLYSLDNPESPDLLSLSSSGYMHDAASVSIADQRKDTQCANAGNLTSCKLLADFNEGSVEIWDISSPADPEPLTAFSYPDASYVHSGWWTEDGRYLLVHDELDETRRSLNTTVRIFDMTNLDNPQLESVWTGVTRAIDHNGFVRGNRYYISNYSEGLTVLDISDPASPSRVALFDTMPTSSVSDFVGAWGVYPFLPSGTILISDINSGLYVLADESRQSDNGGFVFADSSYSGVEGETVSLQVNRIDGDTGAVSVGIELLYLTADSNDASINTTVLEWNAGDDEPKTVNLQLINDASSENIERIAVRLVSPTGGATLQSPNLTHVYISEPSTATELNLLTASGTVHEKNGNAFVTITRAGSIEGEVSVSYRTRAEDEGQAFVASSGTLTWEDGEAEAKTIAISLVQDSDSDGEQTMRIEIHSPVGATLGDNTTTAILITDGSTPAPQNPGNNVSGGSGGSGGGNPGLPGLLLLASLLLYSTQRKLAERRSKRF